jgi:hypothetical protein
MRVFLLAILALATGWAIGYGHNWYEVGDINEQFRTVNTVPVQGDVGTSNVPTVEVVGGAIHNFGIMERLGKRDHLFVIRNTGDAPLTLEQGKTSCKCTISELAGGYLEPGAEVEVRLEWTAKESEPDSKVFEQTAEILTNDPKRRVVRLSIVGKIIQSVWSRPGDIVLTSVTQGNGATASAMIFAYKSDSLEIIDHKFYFTRLEGYLDVHFEDLGEEELSQEVDARSGKKMILKLKPGLPLGDFNEAIRITTNLPDSPRIDVAIQGIVTPDITFLASKRFHRGQRVLDLGIVSQEKGVEEKVMLLAKGPLRESIKFRVKDIEPAGVFQVEVVRRDSSATSKALQHAVVIKVPEGTSQIKRLNPQQEGYGRILLETTHPDIEELEILVRFAIVPTEK